jgi:hypothetical protein
MVFNAQPQAPSSFNAHTVQRSNDDGLVELFFQWGLVAVFGVFVFVEPYCV